MLAAEFDYSIQNWVIISSQPRHPFIAEVVRQIRDDWEHDRVGDRPPNDTDIVHFYTGPWLLTRTTMKFLGVSVNDVPEETRVKYLIEQQKNTSSIVY